MWLNHKVIQMRVDGLLNDAVERMLETKIAEVDAQVAKHKAEVLAGCRKDLAEYEHDYHHAKEVKGIELAQLDARIALLKDVEAQFRTQFAEKNKQIEYLRQMLTDAIKRGTHA
jgi:hypothetical protein